MSRVPGGFAPPITLDRKAEKPLERQIYDAFRAKVLSRDLQPGQQIPSSRSLASEMGISRIPVLNAYAQLLAEGYFESRHGAGTFISRSLPEQLMFCDPGVTAAQTDSAGSPSLSKRVISKRAAELPDTHREMWAYGAGAFSIGQLAFDHFPFQTWSSLVTRQVRRFRVGSLNYGETLGSMEFRETIASYLRTSRAVHCEARQIMVVGGSQQALDVTARVLLDVGSSVWMEEPGYNLAKNALKLAGCRLVPVPVDGEGLDIAAGIRMCRRARAAYVTPSHQFPMGVTMSASRRMQLLEWAHQTGAWIIEDDYDSEYRYGSLPIACLQGLDGGSRVIYIGTFSKTLFPSLRLGYIVIPMDLVERFSAVRRATDLCPPYLYQTVLSNFMAEGHFARHIRKTRLLYGERRGALVEALRKEFGETLDILGDEAGMHLTVLTPPGVTDRDVSAQAATKKLWLWPLSSCYLGPNVRNGFVLGFGSTRATDMGNSVRRFRDLLS